MDPLRNSADHCASDISGEGASQAFPLGPTLTPYGVNFSIFSAHATDVDIVFFDHPDAQQPSRVIKLNPVLNRTSHYWHIFVPGIVAGQLYGYRVDGPGEASGGNRFDCHKVLIDPYGKSISIGQHYDRSAASRPGDNTGTSMKSDVADLSTFDWEGEPAWRRSLRCGETGRKMQIAPGERPGARTAAKGVESALATVPPGQVPGAARMVIRAAGAVRFQPVAKKCHREAAGTARARRRRSGKCS